MQRRRALPIAILATLSVLGAAWAVTQIPRLKRAYWAALEAPGPNQHGDNVTRYPPRNTPYDRWVAAAKKRIPVFEGLVIPNVRTAPLRPWPALGAGVHGLYLRFSDYQMTDGRLIELPSRGSAQPQRHMHEIVLYCLGGEGHAELARPGKPPLQVRWREGTIFSVPLNARYQLFNDGDAPTRLLAVTSFPFVMNALASESFVRDDSFEFADRFDGAEDYYARAAPAPDEHTATNRVDNVRATPMNEYESRGPGATTARWLMAGNTQLSLHSTAIAPLSHLKAHRHSSDAFVLFLTGRGYSLIWRGGDVRHRQRIDWQGGTLFVPPTYWYHEHFNTGTQPAQHLAVNAPELTQNLGLRFGDELDHDPHEIRVEWERELERARSGSR